MILFRRRLKRAPLAMTLALVLVVGCSLGRTTVLKREEITEPWLFSLFERAIQSAEQASSDRRPATAYVADLPGGPRAVAATLKQYIRDIGETADSFQVYYAWNERTFHLFCGILPGKSANSSRGSCHAMFTSTSW